MIVDSWLVHQLARNRLYAITPGNSGSIRQPNRHRLLDVKRPTRAIEELHEVAATRTERRLYVQVVSVTGVSRE
jgi:hypothetical protein